MNEAGKRIAVAEFCEKHGIDVAFIVNLREHGFVEVIEDGEALYLKVEHIPRVEKIVRMHFDLNINLEGIEVISNLLERIEAQRQEILLLRNALRRWE